MDDGPSVDAVSQAQTTPHPNEQSLTIQLNNHSATAIVSAQHGGRLVSLCVHGHELLVSRESDPMRHGCYPMAPWAGRIRNGKFTWLETTYQLPINLPPHAIHGTVFDRPWTPTPNGLTIDLGALWPWPGRVESSFSLQPDAFHWKLTAYADQHPMPVVLGWHPWFRRNLNQGAPLQLGFRANKMMVRDEAGITTPRTVDVPNGPWDDCFVGVTQPVELNWPGALSATISSDCSHWVVYSEPDHAVCVEPQSGPPDAVNLGLAAVVRPGDPLERTMTIRWHPVAKDNHTG